MLAAAMLTLAARIQDLRHDGASGEAVVVLHLASRLHASASRLPDTRTASRQENVLVVVLMISTISNEGNTTLGPHDSLTNARVTRK